MRLVQGQLGECGVKKVRASSKSRSAHGERMMSMQSCTTRSELLGTAMSCWHTKQQMQGRKNRRGVGAHLTTASHGFTHVLLQDRLVGGSGSKWLAIH